MKPIRYNYSSDVDEETKELMIKTKESKRPLTELTIDCSAIAPRGSDYLHLVDVNYRNRRFYFRVITAAGYGVTIVIWRNNDVLLAKYRDLRKQLRNEDRVLVTFPWLKVKCFYKNVLSLYTDDFKVLKEPQPEPPKLYI